MKPTSILVAALASTASAATELTFQEKCTKYKCFTLDAFQHWNPPCAEPCFNANLGSSLDGCAPDDFRCHCKNAGSIASVMRACLTNPATGCFPTDLGAIGAGVNEMCGYFNQTGYEAYKDCGKLLYSFVTFADDKADKEANKTASLQ